MQWESLCPLQAVLTGAIQIKGFFVANVSRLKFSVALWNQEYKDLKY